MDPFPVGRKSAALRLPLYTWTARTKNLYRTASGCRDLDDTALVKKQRYLKYYQKARRAAISTSNIMLGFSTAGVVPWDPRKLLSHPLVLYPQNNDDVERPTTPEPSNISPQLQLTPTNPHELRQAISNLDTSAPLDRNVRSLLTSTGGAFDRIQFKLATTERRLASCQRHLDDHGRKSRRKRPVDPNKQFVNIEDIITAYNRGQAQSATTTTTTTPRKTRAPTSRSQPSQANVGTLKRIRNRLYSIVSR